MVNATGFLGVKVMWLYRSKSAYCSPFVLSILYICPQPARLNSSSCSLEDYREGYLAFESLAYSLAPLKCSSSGIRSTSPRWPAALRAQEHKVVRGCFLTELPDIDSSNSGSS